MADFYNDQHWPIVSQLNFLMDRTELRKVNGDVFFEAYREPGKPFIYANWIGIQSLETVVMGGNHILAMLRENPCHGLLNSNRELIGPWESAVNYLAFKWAPAAKELGLMYFAHVLSPGIFGQRSFRSFKELVSSQLIVKAFEEEENAEDWLLLYLG